MCINRPGVKPLVYVSKAYTGLVSGIGDYGLWIAQYANNNTTDIRLHRGMRALIPAQFASTVLPEGSRDIRAIWI